MSDPIKLTLEQASKEDVLSMAYRQARVLGVPLEIEVQPLGTTVTLTPEQAANHVKYQRALKKVDGDPERVIVKPE